MAHCQRLLFSFQYCATFNFLLPASMSSLSAFGFTIQKGRPGSKESEQNEPVGVLALKQRKHGQSTAAHAAPVPWLMQSSPDHKTHAVTSSQEPTASKAKQTLRSAPARRNQQRNATITQFFTTQPTRNKALPSNHMQVDHEQCRHEEKETTNTCVIRRRISIESIWSTLVENYGSPSKPSQNDTMSVVHMPHGRRRKASFQDEDECKRKIVKVDAELIAAFERMVTGSPRIIRDPPVFTMQNVTKNPYEDDDGEEDLKLVVRHPMTVEDSLALIETIIAEFTMY